MVFKSQAKIFIYATGQTINCKHTYCVNCKHAYCVSCKHTYCVNYKHTHCINCKHTYCVNWIHTYCVNCKHTYCVETFGVPYISLGEIINNYGTDKLMKHIYKSGRTYNDYFP